MLIKPQVTYTNGELLTEAHFRLSREHYMSVTEAAWRLGSTHGLIRENHECYNKRNAIKITGRTRNQIKLALGPIMGVTPLGRIIEVGESESHKFSLPRGLGEKVPVYLALTGCKSVEPAGDLQENPVLCHPALKVVVDLAEHDGIQVAELLMHGAEPRINEEFIPDSCNINGCDQIVRAWQAITERLQALCAKFRGLHRDLLWSNSGTPSQLSFLSATVQAWSFTRLLITDTMKPGYFLRSIIHFLNNMREDMIDLLDIDLSVLPSAPLPEYDPTLGLREQFQNLDDALSQLEASHGITPGAADLKADIKVGRRIRNWLPIEVVFEAGSIGSLLAEKSYTKLRIEMIPVPSDIDVGTAPLDVRITPSFNNGVGNCAREMSLSFEAGRFSCDFHPDTAEMESDRLKVFVKTEPTISFTNLKIQGA